MKDFFVHNWKTMFKSLAVWAPTLATAALILIQTYMDAHVIDQKWMPLVVLVTAYLGRIKKQKSISGQGNTPIAVEFEEPPFKNEEHGNSYIEDTVKTIAKDKALDVLEDKIKKL